MQKFICPECAAEGDDEASDDGKSVARGTKKLNLDPRMDAGLVSKYN